MRETIEIDTYIHGVAWAVSLSQPTPLPPPPSIDAAGELR